MIGKIQIQDASGAVLLEPHLSDKSSYRSSLMGECSVALSFEWDKLVTLPPMARIVYEGETYTLPAGYTPRAEQGRYSYEVSFVARPMLLSGYRCLYLEQGMSETHWTLTGTITQFATVLTANLRRALSTEAKALAKGVNSSMTKTLEVKGDSVLEALHRVAELFDCDWWAEGDTYTFGRLTSQEELDIRLGEIANRFTPNGAPLPRIGRLYAFGGTRNLPRNYRITTDAISRIGELRLKLPQGTPYIDSGIEGEEATHLFEDIFPRYIGSVSAVAHRSIESERIYKISDSNLQIAERYILEGQTLQARFKSGRLNGMEFELSIVDGGYEIVPNDSYGAMLPNEAICPAVGDKYVPYGFDLSLVSSEYIPRAEEELLAKATEWLKTHNEDRRDVSVECNPVYLYEHSISLSIGQRVRLSGATPTGDKVGRIVSLEHPLHSPTSVSFVVGDAKPQGALERIGGEITKSERRAEESTRKAKAEAIRIASRQWAEARSLIGGLERALGAKYSGKIDPIVVQTMQLLAGDESLQFIFVANEGANAERITPAVSYSEDTKKLTIGKSYLKHLTLGVKSISPSHKTYKRWTLPAYTSKRLEYPEREYFVYARCSKTTTQGSFHLSSEPLAMESEEGYYNLLVGLLSAEPRLFTSLYGFSEVLPGQIRTGLISSADGRTYFDLDRGIIGGNLVFRGAGADSEEVDAKGYVDDLIKDTNERIRDTSLSVEYSEDGRTGWHEGGRSTDRYLRQRVGEDGVWSEAIRIASPGEIMVEMWHNKSLSVVESDNEPRELVAFVYLGSQDVSDLLPATAYRWSRYSDNTDADAVWAETKRGIGRRLTITPSECQGNADIEVGVPLKYIDDITRLHN